MTPIETHLATHGEGMFPDVKHLLGWAIMATILFCSLFITLLIYFKIKDVYEGVLLAKIISLLALASFGQSEALNFYLKHHTAAAVSRISALNNIGIVLTIGCVLAVAAKLMILRNLIPVDDTTEQTPSLLFKIRDHSEVIAFVPILYFSIVDALVWLGAEGGPEIGRVCFVVADLPLLMPIMIIFLFTIILNVYNTPDFHILIGGVTIMFILASIVLTQCTRSLLSSRRNQVK
jgi:hypothetical protein